jgi:thiol-disulfide isomerase/thioredoxin
MTGTVALGAAMHRIVLYDGNYDGRYTLEEGDGAFIDFDDDRQLTIDPMSSEFAPFRVPFQLGTRRYQVTAVDSSGRWIRFRELGFAPPARYAKVGEPAPEVACIDPRTGSEVRLSHLRGKVVVVDFWASWCGLCDNQADSLRSLYAEYKNRGLEILAVSYDREETPMAAFRSEHGHDWPNNYLGKAFAENGTGKAYRADGAGMLYLVNAVGLLEGVYTDPSLLRKRIEELLWIGETSSR